MRRSDVIFIAGMLGGIGFLLLVLGEKLFPIFLLPSITILLGEYWLWPNVILHRPIEEHERAFYICAVSFGIGIIPGYAIFCILETVNPSPELTWWVGILFTSILTVVVGALGTLKLQHEIRRRRRR